jgi:hypothetical protein
MESITSETATEISTRSSSHAKIIYTALAAVVFLVSFFKIADLDFWWHLKTGQIIVQQKQFQYKEIYSFTAPGRPYIDHEWLFQVIQYIAYVLAGTAGIIFLKCAVLILIYLLIAKFLLQKNISGWMVITLLIISVAGGRTRFVERPEIFTELFLVCSYLLIDNFLTTKNRNYLVGILPIILVWSNIHAAVILGLILQGTVISALLVEQILKRFGYAGFYTVTRREIGSLAALFCISVLLTGINPNGYRILSVPFELTSIIESGLLNNQEWQQPPAWRLPFFYISVAGMFLFFLLNARRIHLINFLFGSFLAYISLKYVRNVALFSIFMPFLVWPYLREISKRSKIAITVVSATALYWLVIYSPFEFGNGIAKYFPDQIVTFTKQKNLRGNILNSYGFGGYFIWTLYPERKIFIDGRNEVFLPLLEEIVRVRANNLLWQMFLDKYRIDYALLGYWDELEQVTTVDSKGKVVQTYAPFTSTHFPRSRWALIYWDDDGMIFIKRNGINQDLARMEYTSVFPEGIGYQKTLLNTGKLDKTKALSEIQRRLREDPNCKRAKNLLKQVQESP